VQRVAIGALVAPNDGVMRLVDGPSVLLADPHGVDGMWTAVGDDVTHLVLLGERRHEALVRRHAALVSDRGIAVSWRVVPHGPAAVVVLALKIASYEMDAGLLPALVDQFAARMWSGAWMPSVARLEDPAPSLLQHLRSWLPTGAGFLVMLSGERGVARVGAPAGPARAGHSPSSLICAGVAIPQLAIRDALGRSGAEDTVVVPELNLDPRGRFGSARAVEIVGLPLGNDIRLPRPESLPRCVVCAAVMPADFCTYCHVRSVRASVELQGDQL